MDIYYHMLIRKYDFNLAHHPTPEKRFFSYSEKKRSQVGFEPGTPNMNPDHTHDLDCSTMALLFKGKNST